METVSLPLLTAINSDSKLSDNYTLKRMLGSGAFGVVYEAFNKNSKNVCALKIEVQNKVNLENNLLTRENTLLSKMQHIKGIPKIFNFLEGNATRFLEMEILPISLKNRFKHPTYDHKKISWLAYELTRIFEGVHKVGIVHRDLKPENIMLNDKEDEVFLIDFGLSKEYELKQSEENKKKGCMGTMRFASYNAHRGKEILPKDDVESLMYNLIYMMKKTLPWIKLETEDQKKTNEQVAYAKKKYVDRTLPACFQQALKHITGLKDIELPDYNYLKSLFKPADKQANKDPAKALEQKTQKASQAPPKVEPEREEENIETLDCDEGNQLAERFGILMWMQPKLMTRQFCDDKDTDKNKENGQ